MKNGITKKNLLLNIDLKVTPSFLTKKDLADKWKRTSNKWIVRLTYFDKEYVTDFYMGRGLVDKHNKPRKPSKREVLFSMMTGDVSNMTFKDFCDEFGYDNDSIKALKIYEDSQRETEAYYDMFDSEEREALKELLEVY